MRVCTYTPHTSQTTYTTNRPIACTHAHTFRTWSHSSHGLPHQDACASSSHTVTSEETPAADPGKGRWQDIVLECALESRSCQASPGSLAPISKFRHSPALADGAINMAMATALGRERRVDCTPGPALLLGPPTPVTSCHSEQVPSFQAFPNAVLPPWMSSSSSIHQSK